MQFPNIPFENSDQFTHFKNSIQDIGEKVKNHLNTYRTIYTERNRFNYVLNNDYDALQGYFLYTCLEIDNFLRNSTQYAQTATQTNEQENICFISTDEKLIDPEISHEYIFQTQEHIKSDPVQENIINQLQLPNNKPFRSNIKSSAVGSNKKKSVSDNQKENQRIQKNSQENGESYESEDVSLSDEEYDNINNSKRKSSVVYKRGPYNRFTEEFKEQAIELVNKNNGNITKVSKQLNIPCKNLKRWVQMGPKRKEGGGRKTLDPIMEANLLDFIKKIYYEQDNQPVNRRIIREKALVYSQFQDKFKASKGWLEKFINRHQVHDLIQRHEFIHPLSPQKQEIYEQSEQKYENSSRKHLNFQNLYQIQKFQNTNIKDEDYQNINRKEFSSSDFSLMSEEQ